MLEEIIQKTEKIKILAIKKMSKQRNSLDVIERKVFVLIKAPDVVGNFKPQSVHSERVDLMKKEITGKYFAQKYKNSKDKKIEINVTLNPEFILDYLVTKNGTYIKVIGYVQR